MAETLETLLIEVLLDDGEYQRKLQAVLNATQQANTQLRGALNIGDPFQGVGEGAAKVKAQVSPLDSEFQRLNRTALNTRAAFQAGLITQEQFEATLRDVVSRSKELSQGLDVSSKEFGILARASRTAQASLDLNSGRLPRLGLAANVAAANLRSLGTQFAGLNGTLALFGPLMSAAAASMTAVGASATAATAGLTGMRAATAGLLAGLSGVGGAIGLLTAGTAALGAAGLRDLGEYQKSLQILRVSGVTDLQAIEQQLRDLQREGGAAAKTFSRTELAGALSETVKAGVDAQKAFDLLAVGLELASAEGEDVADSTQLLLTNLRQFRLGTEEARRAGDSLAQAGLAAAGSARDLSEGLSTVGPIARAAGFDLEETLGLLVTLDNRGLSAADTGARALGAVFTNLLRPSEQARRSLAALGVDLETAGGEARDTRDILVELRQAIEGSEQAAQVATEIFSALGVRAILNLGDDVEALTEEVRDSEGALRNYSDTLNDTLPGSTRSAKAALSDLKLTLAESLEPTVVALADRFADLVRSIDEAASASKRFGFLFGIAALFDPNTYLSTPTNDLIQQLIDGNITPEAASRSAGVWEPLVQETEGAEEALGNLETTFQDLIAEATRLKGALDAASDPTRWDQAQRAVEIFQAGGEQNRRAWEAVNATLSGTRSNVRGAADVLRELSADLRALDAQEAIFSGIDVNKGRIDAVRSALIELTRQGVDVNSVAVQALLAQYDALGGAMLDAAEAAQTLREEQIELAAAFSSKVVLQAELGFLTPQQARTQLEDAIARIEAQIAAFDVVDLSTGDARAELEALQARADEARAAVQRINAIDLQAASLNFLKLSTDIDSGRQSLQEIDQQLGILVAGLETKLAAIQAGGITALEVPIFADTTRLLQQARDQVRDVQAQIIERDFLLVRMGVTDAATFEAEVRERLASLDTLIAEFEPSIPVNLDLTDPEAVRAAVERAIADAPDEFRALENEAAALTEGLLALIAARNNASQAFADNLTLAVDLEIVDATTATQALQAQLATLQAELREKVLSVDLTVEGGVSEVLQAEINELTASIAAINEALDAIQGEPIDLDIRDDITVRTLADDVGAVAEATDRINAELDTLQRIAQTTGQEFNRNAAEAALLSAVIEELLRLGVDPATEGFNALEARLVSAQAAIDDTRDSLDALTESIFGVSDATQASTIPYETYFDLQRQVRDVTTGSASSLDVLIARIEAFGQQSAASAALAQDLLEALAPNVEADPLLQQVSLTREWARAQSELSRIARQEALTSLQNLRDQLLLLNVDFEATPVLAVQVAQAIAGLTQDITRLGSATSELGTFRENLSAMEAAVQRVTASTETEFDTARAAVRAFANSLEGDAAFDNLQRIAEAFQTIDAAQVTDARTALQELGTQIAGLGAASETEFDRARAALDALINALPDQVRVEVEGLAAGLGAAIDAAEAEDTRQRVQALREEFELLGRDAPSAFERARTQAALLTAELARTPNELSATRDAFDDLNAVITASEVDFANRTITDLIQNIQQIGASSTAFDQARDRVTLFFANLSPEALREVTTSADELFTLIREVELSDIEQQLLDLNLATTRGFDRSKQVFTELRAALQNFGAQTEEERQKVQALLDLLADIEGRVTFENATDSITSLRAEVERLAGTGPTAFESLRDKLIEFRDSTELTEDQLREINELLDALGKAEGIAELDANLKALIETLSFVKQAFDGLDQLINAETFSDAVGGVGGVATAIAGLVGGPAAAAVAASVVSAVQGFVGLVESIIDAAGGRINDFVRETASNVGVLSEATIRELLVFQPQNDLFSLIFGPRLDEQATQVGIDIATNIASGLAGAFGADTLEEFRRQFNDAMRAIVLDGVVQAFILSETVQGQIAELTRLVLEALEDGVIDAGEAAAIRGAQQTLLAEAERFRAQLENAGLLPGGTTFDAGDTADRFELPDVAPGFIGTPQFVADFSASVDRFTAAIRSFVSFVEDLQGAPVTPGSPTEARQSTLRLLLSR